MIKTSILNLYSEGMLYICPIYEECIHVHFNAMHHLLEGHQCGTAGDSRSAACVASESR